MTDVPTWLHRKAPPLGNTYPAWANDPSTGAPPRSYGGLVVTIITAGAALIWLAWWLR